MLLAIVALRNEGRMANKIGKSLIFQSLCKSHNTCKGGSSLEVILEITAGEAVQSGNAAVSPVQLLPLTAATLGNVFLSFVLFPLGSAVRQHS